MHFQLQKKIPIRFQVIESTTSSSHDNRSFPVRRIRVDSNVQELVKPSRPPKCWIYQIRAIACPYYKQVLLQKREEQTHKQHIETEEDKRGKWGQGILACLDKFQYLILVQHLQ
ncbi:hypothetical protein Droror1_Dr00017294 [Drosera rotundifolia]